MITETEETLPHLVNRMSNILQTVLSYTELDRADDALVKIHELVGEMHLLGNRLSGMAKKFEIVGLDGIMKTIKIMPKNTTIEVRSGGAARTVVVTEPGTEIKQVRNRKVKKAVSDVPKKPVQSIR